MTTAEPPSSARRPELLRSLIPKFACLAVALGVTYVFFIQYCDLIFSCGCQALWAGASSSCNIHAPAPPHCPWCLHHGSYGWWSLSGICTAQAGIALWPGAFGLARGISVFLAFPVLGGVFGVAAGLATGYWG